MVLDGTRRLLDGTRRLLDGRQDVALLSELGALPYKLPWAQGTASATELFRFVHSRRERRSVI